MAQFARPISDVSTGAWTSAPLWSNLDESTLSDADFVTSHNNTSPDTFEVALSPITAPSVGAVTLRVRRSKSATGGHALQERFALFDGATLINEVVQATADSTAWATVSLSISNRDAITDWSNLRVRVSREGDTGGSGGTRRSLRVSWIELEAPDAPAAQTFTRTVGDTTAISDVLARTLTLVRGSSDSTTVTESISRAGLLFARTTSDTITTVTDAVARAAQFIRSTSESIAIGADNIISTTAKIFTRTASDTVNLSESVNRQAIIFARSVSESITGVSDNIARAVQFMRNATESISIGVDSVSAVKSFIRTAGDTITSVTDSVARNIIVAGQTVIRTASDTVVIGADAVQRVISVVRSASDSATSVSDVVVRVSTKIRLATDTTGLSESISRSWQGARAAVDTLPAIVDTAVSSAAFIIYRTASDTVSSVTDSVTRVANMARSAVDNVLISESVGRVIGLVRRSTDTVTGISDAVVRSGVVVRRNVEDFIFGTSDFVVFVKSLPKYTGQAIFVANKFTRGVVSGAITKIYVRAGRNIKRG